MHQIITERVKWPQVELVISLVEGKRDRDVLYGIENCIVDSKSYGNTTIITLEYGLKMISGFNPVMVFSRERITKRCDSESS